MKNIILSIFIINVLSAYSQGKSVDKIVALVNDQIILESDLRFYRQNSTDSAKSDCQTMQKFIIDKLLYSKAVKDSIVINDEEVETELENRMDYFIKVFGTQEKFEKYYKKSLSELKAEFRDDVKQQMLSERAKNKLLSGMNPTPKDVKDYFNKLNKDSIQYYNAEMQLAQIVFLPKVTREAKKAAKLKAEKIRQDIINGSGFGTQALLYSDDPGSAAQRGELGWVGPSEMVPEFEQAAFSIPIGQISEIVETQFGLHIIEAMERKNGKTKVRHILISSKPDNDAIAKTQKLADSVRKQILENKLTFQKAVELYSDNSDMFKANGGILLNFKKKSRTPLFQIGDVDEDIAPQINTMHVGDITTPVAYMTRDRKFGYRIVKVVAETAPHKASLETDYNRIKEIVHENMRDRALEKWLKFYKNYVFVKLMDEYKTCPNLSLFHTNP